MGLLLWTLAGCLTSVEDYLVLRDGLMDQDGDGYRAERYGGADCDDAEPGIHPGAAEDCGPVDRDCDGSADGGATDGQIWYADVDGDGFGDAATPVTSCARIAGAVRSDRDCDDRAPDTHPGAMERCGGGDEDCDGAVDEGFDRDGDGVSSCEGDCDDGEPSTYPGAQEICGDGLDNDCDGARDCSLSGELSLWYVDAWLPGQPGEGLGAALSSSGGVLIAGAPQGAAVVLIADPLGEPSAARVWGGEALGRSMAVADLDGDGWDELLAGAVGGAWILPADTAGGELEAVGAGIFGESSAGEAVAAGAGVAVLGAPEDWSGAGVAYLLSSESRATEDAGAVIYGAAGDGVGAGLALEDLDGDGLDDLLVSSGDRVGVFIGPFGGWRAWESSEASLQGGPALSVAGDVDGDGAPDVLLGSIDEALLYTGPLTGALERADAEAIVSGRVGSVAGGDIDGDGRADLIVGDALRDEVSSNEAGAVAVFYGPVSNSLDADSADLRLLGGTPGDRAGRAGAADLDGDGRAEVLVGAPGALGGDGGVYVLLGRGI